MSEAPCQDCDVDRLIGWLTIALGIGVLIPRAGFGLYALLESQGTRLPWAGMLLSSGTVLAMTAGFPWRKVRCTLLVLVTIVWGLLGWNFYESALWGATAQAAVIMWFSASARSL